MEIDAYVRENGNIGIRNKVLVLPSVACVNHVVELISRNVEGVIGVKHEVGCAQVGDDYNQSYRTLAGLASNPNVGGVLVVGLGCERVDTEELAQEISCTKKLVRHLIVQSEGGTIGAVSKGTAIASEMVEILSKEKKEKIPISKLTVGVECGGSDFTSSLTANPAIGHAIDKLCGYGGRAVISEITELIGAEEILAKRCINPKVYDKLHQKIQKMIQYSKSYHRDKIEGMLVPNNISPGNVRGGLTTIEEKSLGATLKGGYKCPIIDVINYSESIPNTSGLYIMDTPSYDIESLTGMAAGGCNLMIFSTGLGTPVGNPISPVIKVTGNKRTATIMRGDIDIDVSDVIDGRETLEEAGFRIFQFLVEVANGMLTKSESLGFWDIGIQRIGPRL